MKDLFQLAALLISLGSPAYATYTVADYIISRDPPLHYLSTHDIDTASALVAPPAAGSSEAQADLAEVLSEQATRTAADCARANTEVSPSLKTLFGPAYGPLTAGEVKRWTSFFTRVQDDANYFIGQEKDYWQRPRPFVDNSSVNPCIPREASFSYPSGHATISRVFAEVLSLLDPTRRTLFLARADQVADDRVLGGVHFPSDIAAGKLLAEQIFQDLEASASFGQDLKAAQVRKYLGHPEAGLTSYDQLLTVFY